MTRHPAPAAPTTGRAGREAADAAEAPRTDLTRPFSRPFRVRFDEAGPNGSARPGTLVRYLQDAAWQHCEAAGFDRAWFARQGMGWLVRGLQLTLLGSATHGEVLTVTTRIAGWRRMWARRHSEVSTPDGRAIASASIDWVLVDLAGRPMRTPAAMEGSVPAAEPFSPLRIHLDATPADALVLHPAVRPSDLDPMGHLNNAGYLDLVDEAVAAATGSGIAPGTTAHLEYLRPALPGMSLDSLVWPASRGLAYRLVPSDGSADLLRASVV